MSESSSPRLVKPASPMARQMDRLTRDMVSGLTRLGISLKGSRVLSVRGRKSGEWRSTPVNLLAYEGSRYLVAPRGHTQWVLNMRAAGGGQLRLGRRVETFTATELTDDQKPELLREYLKRWKFEVGMFFDGVGPDAPTEKLREIAPGYPVFRITTRAE
jgi:deazaflavin-dependent oxidoreductase (nitroreductase family)